MTTTPASAWLAALVVVVLGGLVLASAWFVAWPSSALVVATGAFALGVVGFGVLGRRDARREGLSAGLAVRRGLATAARALVRLFP